MPRLPITKSQGVAGTSALGDLSVLKLTDPNPDTARCEFFAISQAEGSVEIRTQSKREIGITEDAYRLREMDAEVEHVQFAAPPNDWPAPFVINRIVLDNTWLQVTSLGEVNLINRDMSEISDTAYVYDALTGIIGSPLEGTIMIVSSTGTEYMRYRILAPLYFSGLTRAWCRRYPDDWSAAVPHFGHDEKVPPPPADTVHDSVSLKVPDKIMLTFCAISKVTASMQPRAIPAATTRKGSGIFMPIMLRMVSWIDEQLANKGAASNSGPVTL